MPPPEKPTRTSVLVIRYVILGILTTVLLAVVLVQFWMVHLFAESFRLRRGFEGAGGIFGAREDVSRIREAGGEAVAWVDEYGTSAGLEAGDTIIAVNGVTLKEQPQVFYRSFMWQRPGTTVEVRVRNDGVARAVTVVLDDQERWLASQGYLGVSTVPVTQQIADSLGLPSPAGVLVTGAAPHTPAERAGIASGDVIVRFAGREIESGNDFDNVVRSTTPGTTVTVDLMRDGTPRTANATLSSPSFVINWGFHGSQMSGHPRVVTWLYTLPSLLLPLVLLLTGGLIGWAKTRDPIAFECGVVFMLWGLGDMMLFLPFTAAWPDWAWHARNLAHFMAAALIFPMAIRLLSIFPNPSVLGRRLLRRQWLLFLFFLGWVASWSVVNVPDSLAKALFLYQNIAVIVGAVLIGSLIIAQRIETRRMPQARLAVVELGMLLVILAVLLRELGPLFSRAVPSFVRPAYGYLVEYMPLLLYSAFAIAFAYTILTRRVFGIRFIVRKGLQHLLVSRGAFLCGWLVVFALVHVILSRGSRWSESVTAVSALAVGAAFAGTVGLRRINVKLMRTIDRRFFREALDVRRLLSHVSAQLSDLRDKEKIQHLVASQVLAALHPSRVALFLKKPGEEDLESALVLESDRMSPGRAASSHESQPIDTPLILKSAGAVIQKVERDGWAAVVPEKLDPQMDEGARLLRTGCELLIAIPSSEGLLGVMGLGPKLSEEPFSGEDRELLLTVARQAGMALENAELVEVAKREAQHAKELDIARDVQRNLFPKDLPAREGWQSAAMCRPARAVGGDYYDVFEIDSARVAIALGDVSGKGLGPALMMSSIHAMTRSGLPPMAAEPARFVESLNEHLVGSTSTEMFATLFVGVLDTSSGELRYVNAGHNPPIVAAAGSAEVSTLATGGLIVGALPGVQYTDACLHMGDGDLLVLFSDGITEAMSPAGEMFDEERLKGVVERARQGGSASDVLSAIIEAVDRFAAGAEQADDISVVVLARTEVPGRS